MRELDIFCDMLATYPGRDKIMKLLCYSTKLVAGLNVNNHPELSKSFSIFSSKVSAARATLRLIDDIPLLNYTLEYGLGTKEKDKTLSCMNVLANIVDHLYYPTEKICYLAEHNIINVNNASKWDTLCSIFWVASIYLNLMKTIKGIVNKKNEQKHSNKLDNSECHSYPIWNIMLEQKMEMITVFRLSLDLMQAVSTLPNGYFWGGKLEPKHIGLIGSISALLGIYQYLKK